MISVTFHLVNRGDDSVGIDGWYEKITLIWHERNDALDTDELEGMRVALCEWGDGCQVSTDEEYRQAMSDDGAVDDATYRQWMADEVRKAVADTTVAKKLIARLGLE